MALRPTAAGIGTSRGRYRSPHIGISKRLEGFPMPERCADVPRRGGTGTRATARTRSGCWAASGSGPRHATPVR